MVGLYILHPNNVGRCGHICNASYAVKSSERGKKIGEILVRHSLAKAKEVGFKILQFNAVVSTNTAALHLYKKLGFSAWHHSEGLPYEKWKLSGYHSALLYAIKNSEGIMRNKFLPASLFSTIYNDVANKDLLRLP